jgi:transposase
VIRGYLGIEISPGTLVNMVKKVENSTSIKKTIEWARKELLKSPCVGADETTMRVGDRRVWVHVAATEPLVLFWPHLSRSKKAMEEIGFIPAFSGVLVHDFYKAYYAFKEMDHAACLAHLQRELRGVIEEGIHVKWAVKMHAFISRLIERIKENSGVLPERLQRSSLMVYMRIVNEGLAETGGDFITRPQGEKKPGRIKKSASRNLLERFRDYPDSILRCMSDPDVPTTNNFSERPIRMLKVRDKISGCFKSIDTLLSFLDMRSYLMMCRNNGISDIEAIRMAIEGRLPPFVHISGDEDNAGGELGMAA